MNLALGVWFLWVGAGLLYLASHGLGAATPWGGVLGPHGQDARRHGGGGLMPPKARGYQGRHSSGDPDPPARSGTKPATETRRRGPQHDSGQTKPRKLTGAAAAGAKSRRAPR